LIVRCANDADVRETVAYARAAGLPATIRGGGHGIAGHAVLDDTLLLDLSAMTGVRVDPHNAVVRAQGGCLQRHVDEATQPFGLAVTGGIVSHTGIGGLTLGGGIGWLMRKFGLAADNLLSCRVVTADGNTLTASETENPDLLWGLHGGGGNFGVVTEFAYRLHPVPPTVLAGLIAYPMDQADSVLRFFRDFAAEAPDELGLIALLRLAPPLSVVPVEAHGKPIVGVMVCYAGQIDDGERVLRPLREFGTPLFDAITAKPYVEHQQFLDPAFPHGRHYFWKSWKLPPLTDDAMGVIIEHAARITSPYSAVPIFTLGGAVARVHEGQTAYPHRAAAHDINIIAGWAPSDPDPARHIAWVRDFWAALAPYSSGVYVNFMSDEPAAAVRTAYGSNTYEQLVSLKNSYDPTNFFRFNQNIAPSRPGA
jgi:FAD/FMN-containing dehydrogenase